MRCLLCALVLLGEVLATPIVHGAELKKPVISNASAGSLFVGKFALQSVEQERSAFSCHATSPSFTSALRLSRGSLSINSLRTRRLGRSRQFTMRGRVDGQVHRFLIQVTPTRARTIARLQERVWSKSQSACRFTYRGRFSSI